MTQTVGFYQFVGFQGTHVESANDMTLESIRVKAQEAASRGFDSFISEMDLSRANEDDEMVQIGPKMLERYLPGATEPVLAPETISYDDAHWLVGALISSQRLDEYVHKIMQSPAVSIMRMLGGPQTVTGILRAIIQQSQDILYAQSPLLIEGEATPPARTGNTEADALVQSSLAEGKPHIVVRDGVQTTYYPDGTTEQKDYVYEEGDPVFTGEFNPTIKPTGEVGEDVGDDVEHTLANDGNPLALA